MDKNNSKPIISIVVPVYNTGNTISYCLDFLTKQTYNTIEIIVVDDGSQDNSASVIKKYMSKDKRIAYYYKNNGGLSSARNYGIEKSKGDYITFVDSDDYVDISYVESLLKLIIDKNSDVSMCNMIEVDTKHTIINSSLKMYDESFSSQFIFDKSIKNSNYVYITACAKLFKKGLLNNSSFKCGYIHEDDFFSNDIYSKNIKITTTHKQLYFYTRNNGGITSNLNKTEKLFAVDALLERLAIMNYYNSRYTFFVKNSIYGRILHSIKHIKENSLKKRDILLRIKKFKTIKPHSSHFLLMYIKLLLALLTSSVFIHHL